MLENIYIYTKKHELSDDDLRNISQEAADNGINFYMTDDTAFITKKNSVVLTDISENEWLCAMKTKTGTNPHEKNIFAAGLKTSQEAGYKYVLETPDVGMAYYRLMYARMADEPFVVAETENLLIREMTIKDLPELYSVYKTLEDCPYVEPLYEYEKELEFTRNYIENMYRFFEYGLWLLFEKKSGVLVGRAGIENRQIDGVACRELGYLIRKDMQHKGYAYEACVKILEYAVDELGIEEIFAAIDKTNEPSRRLAQKLGFEFYAQTGNGPDLFKKKL